MIANISSAESSFEETLNTLKYANRAKNIRTNAQRNVLNVNYHISEYVQLITNLRGEIKMLKDQLSSVPEQQSTTEDDDDDTNVSKQNNSSGGSGGSSGERSKPNLSINSNLSIPTYHHVQSPGVRHATTPLAVLRESMKSAAGLGAGEGRELLNQMRENIVENFQERMQLRRF